MPDPQSVGAQMNNFNEFRIKIRSVSVVQYAGYTGFFYIIYEIEIKLTTSMNSEIQK